MNKRPRIFKISYKITIMAVLMVIVCATATGIFISRRVEQNLYHLKGITAQNAAAAFVSALDVSAVKAIIETGEQDGYYEYLCRAMQAACEKVSGMAYINMVTMVKDGFEVVYAQTTNGEYVWNLGYLEPFDTWDKAAFDAYERGVNTYSEPYFADGYGGLISGYCPVIDENGEVIAIVGFDISLEDIYVEIDSLRNNIILIVAFSAFLFSGVSVLYTKRSIGEPIAKLSLISNNIVKGDMSGNVQIKSNDEVGILSKNFEKMQTTINDLRQDIRNLIKNAADGVLDCRAQTDKYPGGWGELATELNHLLDEVSAKSETILSGIEYASKIQINTLPDDSMFSDAFSDYSVIWKPRDVVGGDVYWMKQFEEGTVLCVCDCTGHGMPGAMLTMLVVSALEGLVKQTNCHDTAEIIWRLERRLVDVFAAKASDKNRKGIIIRDGCDIAVMFIKRDRSVTLSSGNTNVFICNGTEVRRIKGQRIYVGEGLLNGKGDINTVYIQADRSNKFYIASDGLFDQPGGKRSIPFGYARFKKIILENHSENQSVITGKIWEAFEEYRGEKPRVDDFELITFSL